MTAATALAATAPSSSAEPGTLGFLVVAGMAVVLVFLFRSMTKHLRKVTGSGKGGFPGPAGPAGPDSPAGGDGWVQASATDEVPGTGATGTGAPGTGTPGTGAPGTGAAG